MGSFHLRAPNIFSCNEELFILQRCPNEVNLVQRRISIISSYRANIEACTEFQHLLSCPDPGVGEGNSGIVGSKGTGGAGLPSRFRPVETAPHPTLAEAVLFPHELCWPHSVTSMER